MNDVPIEVAEYRDAYGEVALLLCESLLHVLVEEGVISKGKALCVIDTVVELTREMAEYEARPAAKTAARIAETIAKSFAMNDRP
jgi:hypothetical protein